MKDMAALGGNCSRPSDCAGAVVHCEPGYCACLWEAQLSGDQCQTLTVGSWVAIAMRILYVIIMVTVIVHQFRFFPEANKFLKSVKASDMINKRAVVRLVVVQMFLTFGALDFVARNLLAIAHYTRAVSKEAYIPALALLEAGSSSITGIAMMSTGLIWIEGTMVAMRLEKSFRLRSSWIALVIYMVAFVCVVVITIIGRLAGITTFFYVFMLSAALTLFICAIAFAIAVRQLRRHSVRVVTRSLALRIGQMKRTAIVLCAGNTTVLIGVLMNAVSRNIDLLPGFWVGNFLLYVGYATIGHGVSIDGKDALDVQSARVSDKGDGLALKYSPTMQGHCCLTSSVSVAGDASIKL